MAFTVEDGSCVNDANALVSLADADAFFADFGGAWSGDDSDKESAIIRASTWLSTFPVWDGSQVCGRVNGLAWPRTGTTDCNGNSIPSNEIPREVKQATYIAALAELINPGALNPTVTPGKQVKRNKVDVIEQEFMTPADQLQYQGGDPVTALRPVYTQIQDLLKCMATFKTGRNTPWPFAI